MNKENIMKSGNLIVYNTNVPVKKVWEIIGAVDGVEKWFEPIKSCTVSGSKRTCGIDGNLTFDEEIILVDHKNKVFHYAITMQPMIPVTNLSAAMSVLSDSEGNGVIVWSGTYDVEREKESDVKEMFARAWLMGAKGIESYILSDNK